MADLTIRFSKADYDALEGGAINTADFLTNVLLNNSADGQKSKDKIADLLLSYHSDDGGSMRISDLGLKWADYDSSSKTGKIGFYYCLGYYYTCSDSNKNYNKNDTIDFIIDTNDKLLILKFMDLTGRSTAEEF